MMRRNGLEYSIRSVSLELAASEHGTVCCVCLEKATGSKPYCVEHLDRLPYVARIRGQIEDHRQPTRLTR